tara:strand:+ start:6646 stop:7776 length:1131 start_codon:yes stop_codon:yes gene_type:complete
MANKDLFKQAIAEAKSVREAAIANAKEALEETLTPHLKDMLAAKLQEMEDSKKDEEVVNEVEEEVEEAKHHDKDHKDEGKKSDDKMDETTFAEEMDDAEPVAMEADSDDSEDEAPEEAGDDEELGNLSVDQFKDLIRDIISQEMGDHSHDDMPADDMDAGDMETPDEAEMDDEPESIDLDELLAELEALPEGKDEDDKMEEKKHGKDDDAMEEKKHSKDDKAMEEKKHNKDKDAMEEDTSNQVNAESEGKDYNLNRTIKEDLDGALETIDTLKKELSEVNILNSKLLYVNKIFKANDLNESQKVNVIAAFDKAETVKEVKLVYETVSDNFVTKKETTIKEHKGMASKATGTTASKPEVIAEVSDTVLRMQKLAGIK